MNKRKGSLSVDVVIELVCSISILLTAGGNVRLQFAKASLLDRTDPNDKKKTDHSEE